MTKIPLPEDVAARLSRAVGSEVIFETFDFAGARGAELPFLPEHWLVLLPHKTELIEVPLVLTGDTCIVAEAVYEWLYEMMRKGVPEVTPEMLLAYVRFFFSVVVSSQGAFLITQDVSEVLWNEGANDGVKQEFASSVRELTWIREAPDGRNELRGTVVFQNALFETSIMVSQNWKVELTNEGLRMEDLPIEFGRRSDLLVRY